ncbi:MAG: hypothetical protein EOM72_05435 [Opitutae bacterium]|nr:hypothetical protein [Opitutae bacterium]
MMKQAALWGLGMALGATLAFGQAALPTSHSGPWKTGPLPTGWTQKGLDTDYKTDYDGSGENAAKFNDAGDFIQIYFNGAPSKVSYYTQANSLIAGYVFKVQESLNGSSWTDVSTFSSASNSLSSSVTQYTNNLLSSSRYVRFIFVTDNGGGIGIDGVAIVGPGVPSITFDPSGSQSISVSNLLALAVSITPSGSGMESWSLTPSFAGSTNFTGGTFQMTPYAGDSGKTFTLRVVGSNSVGKTTGTVTIAVTTYVPPKPIITFSPAAPYSVMATHTQKLGIAMTPVGSVIDGWTLLPSNYTGSATLVGTNFTFATAQADGPSNYTLSVIATNPFGATTGTVSIAVAEYIAPPPPGSVVVDFEDASASKDNYYPLITNTLSGRSWLLGGATSPLDNDKKFGAMALRIRCEKTNDTLIKFGSLSPFASGIESISLWFATYGNDSTNNAPQVSIQISTNINVGWVTLDTINTGSATELAYRFYEVKVKEPVYFRLWSPQTGKDSKANIDNIVIAPYVVATGYEAFLLRYNVTPGDPGTARGEDLDGDEATNQEEFDASPQTNPYDEASSPPPP